VILAAWLQRIFESSDTRLTILAWYIAAALFPVMLGLLSVGIVCFLDIRCAQYMTDSFVKQYGRLVRAKGWTAPQSEDERQHGAALGAEIEQLEPRARRLDSWSQRAGLTGWALLAASFAILATGVVVMVSRCCRAALWI
jgi:hypothetical protein